MLFSIGRYRDEVYFDIVDIDARHLLLGKPWHYDVSAQHVREENVYRLKKDGMKYVLIPLKVVNCTKACKVEGRSFLTTTQPEKGMEDDMREPNSMLYKSALEYQSCESQEGTPLEGVELKAQVWR